ncbi:Rhamnulokinase [Citrobacter freundii]|uniref:Rhamnulokinase n=1 Tax=Citrobacter freundii TaxID=546 RepID=A0A7G2INS4_CITFR|nr:Rhamnulokinase [Citrobacter freundii]
MTFRHCVAVDLGASSGRVMLARYDSEHRTLTLREIHRFVNCLQKTDGFDTWDIDSLENDIRLGLKKVCDEGIRIDSIGIDTWGVDYVLIDNVGQRVGLPVSYRDSRTTGIMAQAMAQRVKVKFTAVAAFSFCPLTPCISCVRWLNNSQNCSRRWPMPC